MSAFFDIDYPDYKPVEIKLKSDDDFLKVRETLSRIGVASKKDKILYQSCHILHKQGRYFITHFKELFALDGKEADLSDSDLQRRNAIAKLLSDWGLIELLDSEVVTETAPMSQIKILPYKEKDEWTLVTKYNIGRKK
tara:strand:- start:20781 stop:21194 length:414 start_codon:yes stop_codon:yes gene_type:complete